MMQLVEEVDTLIYTLLYTLIYTLLRQYNIRTSDALSAASFIQIFFFSASVGRAKMLESELWSCWMNKEVISHHSCRPVLLRLSLSCPPLEKKDLPVFKAVIETT